MIQLILTLDYEIYGNGTGQVDGLVLRPTEQIMSIGEEFGAPITIFAEVAEFLAMKGVPACWSDAERVEAQLKDGLARGHDVQLHLHPQWFDASRNSSGEWLLDVTKVSIARLGFEECSKYLKVGKEYLEGLLQPVRSEYECIAFRSGFYCMTPSASILPALAGVGIKIDSSVFKWGREHGAFVEFDFTGAHSDVMPWYVCGDDINVASTTGDVLEIPIYVERVPIWGMVNRKTLKLRRLSSGSNKELKHGATYRRLAGALFQLYPRKLDFCRLTYREMAKTLDRLVARLGNEGADIPVCAIGHSKDFIDPDGFRRMLKYIREVHSNRIRVTTYAEALRAFKGSTQS